MSLSITSANSIYLLSIPSLAITNYRLQNFSAESAFTTETMQVTENEIGVDGKKAAGYVPNLRNQTITFQANSGAISIFDTIFELHEATEDIVIMDAIIQLPSIKKVYTLAEGTLQSYLPIQNAQRVLQSVECVINWGITISAPL